MALREYKRKRNFAKTPEPGPSKAPRTLKPLKFVVQEHHARRLHYDFRLEWRGVLKSWAVPKGPPRKARERRLAVMTEDHPFDYKDFAGTIPKGEYGAGKVTIWDKGVYTPVKPMDKGLRDGHITFVILGKKIKGEYALVRLKNDPDNWLMIKADT